MEHRVHLNNNSELGCQMIHFSELNQGAAADES